MCLLISYRADVASLQESTHTKRHAKKKIKKKNTLFAATDKVNKLLLQRAPGAQLEAPPCPAAHPSTEVSPRPGGCEAPTAPAPQPAERSTAQNSTGAVLWG